MGHINFSSVLPTLFTYYRQFTSVKLSLAHNEGKWGGGPQLRSNLALTQNESEWSFPFPGLFILSSPAAL